MADGMRALIYEKLRPGLGMVEAFERRGIHADLPFGPQVCLRRGNPLSQDEIIDLATGYDVILGASCAKLSRPVLEALPDLRMISKIGIGYDVIDLDAATDLGIVVTNTPSPIEIDCVAEHAVTLLLACAKRLDFYTADRMKGGRWLDAGVSAVTVRDKTVGILGFGRIARQVAVRLQGWGLRVLVNDLPGAVTDVPPGVELVDKETLLAESDFVTLHVSKAIDAPAVIGKAELDAMKPGSILVNTSRGGNIDQSALVDALESGHLRAAGLDVFESEPPVADDRLLTLDNVLLTPHLGAVTPESEHDMEMMAVDNACVVLGGDESPWVLNPAVLAHDRLRVRR